MALAESSAFTEQWRTAYHFHTVAGHDVFWPVFENQLDALLNPDYTDEEIRREVRNFGVDKGDDGTLHLEEKGTVYNEMVRAYESARDAMLWRDAGQLVYGAKHPLALDSGGFPDAIRTMTPTDIRTFHDAHYHLANMGMIGAFPSSMSLASVLDHTGADPRQGGRAAPGKVDRPRPTCRSRRRRRAGHDRGRRVSVRRHHEPGPDAVRVAGDARRSTRPSARCSALFLDAFAGDESTPLYKKLIDGKTRAIDLGATRLFARCRERSGPAGDARRSTASRPTSSTSKTLADVRALDRSPSSSASRSCPTATPSSSRSTQRVAERGSSTCGAQLAKFLDTPPRLRRSAAPARDVDRSSPSRSTSTPGFAKSLTMRPALAAIEQAARAARRTRGATRIASWGLLDAPYGVAAKPSPALRKQLDAERTQRDRRRARAPAGSSYGTTDAGRDARALPDRTTTPRPTSSRPRRRRPSCRRSSRRRR